MFSAVLLASLPTATNVFVIAQQYGVWVERASASVLITTCLSVLTVTSLLYLITSGMLPPDLFPQSMRRSRRRPLPGLQALAHEEARSGAKAPSRPRPALRATWAGSMLGQQRPVEQADRAGACQDVGPALARRRRRARPAHPDRRAFSPAISTSC